TSPPSDTGRITSLFGTGFLREIELLYQTAGDRRHVAIPMHETSTPPPGSSSDQRICQRKPFRHLAANIECLEGYSFIDYNQIIQQFTIALDCAARVF